jgi:hypothetical protein
MAADPFFVVGSGRSGTTILAACLGRHPDLLLVDEPRFLSDILFPCLAGRIHASELSRRLATEGDGSGKEPMKLLRRLAEHYGERLGVEGLEEIREAARMLIGRACERLESSSRPEALALVRETTRALADLTCARLGGGRWLVKQPDLSTALDLLVETFPETRFVHALRCPEDVIGSRLDRGYQPDFDSALHVWESRTEAVVRFARRHPRRVLHVHLEELCRAAVPVLEEALGFLGLAPARPVLEAAAEVRLDQAHLDRGAGRFSAGQAARISASRSRLNALAGSALVPQPGHV